MKKEYIFNVVSLGKDNFHCLLKQEDDTLELYRLLKKKYKLVSIYFVSGLMQNIFIKGNKGLKFWSDNISNHVNIINRDKKLFSIIVNNSNLALSKDLRK